MHYKHYHIIIVEATKKLDGAKHNMITQIKEIIDKAERNSLNYHDLALYTIVNFYNSSTDELCSNVPYKDLPINNLIRFETTLDYYRYACGLDTLNSYIDLIGNCKENSAIVSFYVIGSGIDNSGVSINTMYKRIELLKSNNWQFNFYAVYANNLVKRDDLGMFCMGMFFQCMKYFKSSNTTKQKKEESPSSQIEVAESKPKLILDIPIDQADKYWWITQLKNIHNRLTWNKTEIDHLLTKEDQYEAEKTVSQGSKGYFSYIRDKYFYNGKVVQIKPLPWSELFEI